MNPSRCSELWRSLSSGGRPLVVVRRGGSTDVGDGSEVALDAFAPVVTMMVLSATVNMALCTGDSLLLSRFPFKRKAGSVDLLAELSFNLKLLFSLLPTKQHKLLKVSFYPKKVKTD